MLPGSSDRCRILNYVITISVAEGAVCFGKSFGCGFLLIWRLV